MTLKDFTFGFVGLGLMGGSLAKAIRQKIIAKNNGKGKIFACDKNPSCLLSATEQHIIDKGFKMQEVSSMLLACDFVYICLYPHKTAQFLIEHRHSFKNGSIVTDISGVKSCILCRDVNLKDSNADFIPGHPMAGSEKEGFDHSKADIFENRNYILMPQPDTKPQNLALLEELIHCIGFTRIIKTDYKTHDHKIAFTSQLCHIIASALVLSAEDENITEFGGGSFEDLTRIAMINSPLWTELFLANKQELLCHIENFQKSIQNLKMLIQTQDATQLQDTLQIVRQKRTAMSKK